MCGKASIGMAIAAGLYVLGCGGSSFTSSPTQPPPASSSSVPVISSISPTSATAGSSDLTVTIAGSNFTGDLRKYHSVVTWFLDGSITSLATTYVDAAHLTTVIPAALLSTPVDANIGVQTWYFANDTPFATSNQLSFTVTPASPTAVVISPSSDVLLKGGFRQFASTIGGKTADVTWEIQEGPTGGSITSGGLYAAPATVGTFHIDAISTSDASNRASATVSVVNSGFTATGSMHMPRSGHRATLLTNGKVLIIGADGSAELFDPVTGSFSVSGSMTTSRTGATATLLADGKVLVTGGFGPGSTAPLPRLNSAELYDPIAGTFSPTGSMAVGRVLHTATPLNDGRVLIAGGTDSSVGGGSAVASTELYDPSSGAFALGGSMLTGRAQHTATLLPSGQVLIVGGWNGYAADASDDPPWDPLFAELYEPSSRSFQLSDSMTTTRIRHTATSLANGNVLLLGGIPNPQNVHVVLSPFYAEVYDLATHTFSPLRNVTILRTAYTSTLLGTGMVLIAGGTLNGVVDTAELLNPLTGSLSPTGGLVTARKGHTATRLLDGRVLIVGGTDTNGNPLASAEIYQ